ncbi:MAG: molybdopterin-binding protein [Thermodesulfobacteriota bacterium]
MELELFEKKEIWIRPIRIRDVDLGAVAEKVAEALHLKKSEVMVVDVREDLITLDIMKRSVPAQDIIGKKEAILQALRSVPGISLTPDTTLHSEGVLGLIDIEDQKLTRNILDRMEQMGREISDRIRKRVIVFPSGFEIQRGMIQDTNSPYIKKRLTEEGFNVTVGDVLEDDLESIVSVLYRVLGEGYGLIITTGGVGAEDKDRTIEAILRLDPTASTPYIIHYKKGTGRHEKDGVRIGVAFLKPSFIVALPGPHEEVKMGLEVLIEGLEKRWDKEALASSLSQKYLAFLRTHHSEGETACNG